MIRWPRSIIRSTNKCLSSNSSVSSKLWPSTSCSHHFDNETTCSGIALHINDFQVRTCHSRINERKGTSISKSSKSTPHFLNQRITLLPRVSFRPLHTSSTTVLKHKLLPSTTNTKFHIARRMMSTEKENEVIKDRHDEKVVGGGINKTLLASMLVSTGLAAYVISPENIEHMKSSEHEYSEVEVEDDIYNQMQDVSKEVRGEITRKILGKELADMVEAEHKTAGNTADVVADVLNSEALQNAIASLITRVVSSEQFQKACQTLLKNLWSDLVNDPETLAQIIALLNTAIKDEQIKKSFKELMLGLLQDEEVYNELTGLVVKLGEDNEVLDATKELLTESAHQALNDPEILDHSMEFATDIVGDNVIQRTSGEALRNTVTYAVRPSLSTFLSIFGVALLFFSASALGQARIAAGQGKEIDAAASVVAKSLGDSAWKAILKIVAMPSNGVTAIGTAAANILLAPFNLIGGALMKISQTGTRTLNVLQDFLYSVASSPGLIGKALMNSFISIRGSIVHACLAGIHNVTILPEVLLTRARAGIVALGANATSVTASMARMLYASLSLHTAKGLEFCRSGLSVGIIRTATSFDIIFKNLAAQGRRQIIVLNGATERILASILAALSQFLWRNKTDSAP